MTKTGAIVAAAGLSSRMGSFKPLLPFGSSTVIGHLISTLQSTGISPIVVITGYNAHVLEDYLRPFNVRLVKNEKYATTEMLDSIKLGIRDIVNECERLLIVPADMPAIGRQTLMQILSADGSLIRTSYKGKRGHPIILSQSIARQILDYSGPNGLKGALLNKNWHSIDVVVDDLGTIIDADTPEQYRELVDLFKDKNVQ